MSTWTFFQEHFEALGTPNLSLHNVIDHRPRPETRPVSSTNANVGLHLGPRLGLEESVGSINHRNGMVNPPVFHGF